MQTDHSYGIGGTCIGYGIVVLNGQLLCVGYYALGIRCGILVSTFCGCEYLCFCCLGVASRKGERHVPLGSGRINDLNVHRPGLIINAGRGINRTVPVCAKIGFDDDFSVKIAAHMLPFLLDPDGVIFSCGKRSGFFSKYALKAVLTLLYGMFRIVPASEVEPGIVVLVNVIEDDEEAFRTALFRGVNRHVKVRQVIDVFQPAADIGL